MNPSNRTIEEKLAIVQQLRSNSNNSSPSKTTEKILKTSKYISETANNQNQTQDEEIGLFPVFLIIRIAICFMLFGVFIFMGSRNPEWKLYINTMITAEENGNLIDFMTPFTYTLQEGDESTSEIQEETETDLNLPSEEN